MESIGIKGPLISRVGQLCTIRSKMLRTSPFGRSKSAPTTKSRAKKTSSPRYLTEMSIKDSSAQDIIRPKAITRSEPKVIPKQRNKFNKDKAEGIARNTIEPMTKSLISHAPAGAKKQEPYKYRIYNALKGVEFEYIIKRIRKIKPRPNSVKRSKKASVCRSTSSTFFGYRDVPSGLESKSFTFAKSERFNEFYRKGAVVHDKRFGYNPRDLNTTHRSVIDFGKTLARDGNVFKAKMTPAMSVQRPFSSGQGVSFDKMIPREYASRTSALPLGSSINERNLEKSYDKLSTIKRTQSFNFAKGMSRIKGGLQVLPLFMECTGTRLSITFFGRETFDHNPANTAHKVKRSFEGSEQKNTVRKTRSANSLRRYRTWGNANVGLMRGYDTVFSTLH